MALPPTPTAEQRAAALATAGAARRARAELTHQLNRGTITLIQVLRDADTDTVIGNTRVCEVLAAMPEIGKTAAHDIMTEVQIAPTRRLRALTDRQRHALLERFDLLAS